MRAQLPEKPAIYFAIDTSGKTQYIGKSINPRQRWIHHHHYISLSRMGNIRIAWLEIPSPEKLPELEKALIESFQPPLNRVFNPTYLITNPIAYHLELPKKLRTQFKGMTAMNGTNMKDALTHEDRMVRRQATQSPTKQATQARRRMDKARLAHG